VYSARLRRQANDFLRPSRITHGSRRFGLQRANSQPDIVTRNCAGGCLGRFRHRWPNERLKHQNQVQHRACFFGCRRGRRRRCGASVRGSRAFCNEQFAKSPDGRFCAACGSGGKCAALGVAWGAAEIQRMGRRNRHEARIVRRCFWPSLSEGYVNST
jgi:hypothetical protein